MIVSLENIQSIASATYELPERGLVQIIGNNSNGKSILIKAITAVALLKVIDPEERRALIRDGKEQAAISIFANGKLLLVKLHEERDRCMFVLQRDVSDESTQIARYFREGGLRELVNEFGFRCYANNGLCLQSHETYGLVPFINTSKVMNGEIVESAITDTVAQQYLKNYAEVTHKLARDRMAVLNERIAQQKQIIENCVTYDYRAYEEIETRLSNVWDVLRHLRHTTLQEVMILPPVDMIDIYCKPLEEVVLMSLYQASALLEDVTETIINLEKLYAGYCPACGRPLIEGGNTCRQ